jgi:hypothetical protein
MWDTTNKIRHKLGVKTSANLNFHILYTTFIVQRNEPFVANPKPQDTIKNFLVEQYLVFPFRLGEFKVPTLAHKMQPRDRFQRSKSKFHLN